MKFFKDEEQRNLWIRLNAEHIRYGEKVFNGKDIQDLGGIDEQFSPMWISNNQLRFDEEHRNAPRFSFEELSTLSQDELVVMTRKRNRETIKTLFEDHEFGTDSDDHYNWDNV